MKDLLNAAASEPLTPLNLLGINPLVTINRPFSITYVYKSYIINSWSNKSK